jgi:hypothetical protein
LFFFCSFTWKCILLKHVYIIFLDVTSANVGWIVCPPRQRIASDS